ncbi:PQQ-dependent sugar dehydrogenase [bacterium]|nr:PQQ-dependent sugar dehydrogenase [bacterium]
MKKILKLALSGSILSFVANASEVPGGAHFAVETVSAGLVDAMEIAVLPTGDVLIAERTGALKWYQSESGETVLVKTFDVSVRRQEGKKSFSRETGLLGVTADPDFIKNGWIYCYYSPREVEEHRLSRFTFQGGNLSDEKVMFRVPQSREEGVCHEGGSLKFDSAGHLFISTGDNAVPFAADDYAPLDERPGFERVNSQRSASNTNDLRGKILRIIPQADGTYTIPEGNLFPVGQQKTRPEIFVMGCRNPWRIGIDSKTNTLYWGDVGPDASEDTSRGPRGYCEINQAKTAGNYGWPYFVADNKAYARYDFKTKEVGEKFDPAKPVNESRLNTGLRTLSPARKPFWFEPRSSYCAGSVYHYGDYPDSASKLPKSLDACLVTYDWNNGHMQLSKVGTNGELEWKKDWLHDKKFVHPSDVEFGPDGSMYVLEYGSLWYDGSDGKLKRVTFSEEKQELVEDEADPRLRGISPAHPGYALLSEAICLSCHQTQVTSIGPSYQDVAMRYRGDEKASKYLAKKILEGGAGVWGEIPMPANPQYNREQVSQMVDAILSLAPEEHKE